MEEYTRHFQKQSTGFERMIAQSCACFLTKNGEGDLVVMDIKTYDQREKQLELREKLIEIEERRQAGVADIAARDLSAELRARYLK